MLIVEAARTLLGTPYHARMRVPGLGIDCIGVPIVASWLSGLRPTTFDIQGYSMQPDGSMLHLCDEHMTRIEKDEMQPGDVVVLQYGKQPHHIGVTGDYRHGGLSIIHAENDKHFKVIEHRLAFEIQGAMKFVRAYRIEALA